MPHLDFLFDDLAIEGAGSPLPVEDFLAQLEAKTGAEKPLSTEEFLAQLEIEACAEDEAEFSGMSRYARERIEKGRAETKCRESCKDLRALLIERRKAIFAALYKPILVPASLIGALIAAAMAKGDIGPIIAGIGVAIDVGGTAWLLNRTREKLLLIKSKMNRCRRVIQEYRDKYGREVEWILAEEHLDSENNIF